MATTVHGVGVSSMSNRYQSPPARRDVRVDFFRGLALLIIYIDHVHPNLLASFTLQRFAFLDAADVFVFISGYVIGMVYTKELWRGGLKACCQKAAQRWMLIYRWHIAVSLGTLLILECFALRGIYASMPGLNAFLQAPFRTLLSIVGLVHTTDLLSILPLYLVLTVLAPFAVYFLDKASGLFLLASASVYAAIQWTAFHGAPGGHPWFFLNPLAWQFLFVLGIWLGGERLRGRRWTMSSKGWVTALCAIATFCLAWIAVAISVHRFARLFHTEFWLTALPGLLALCNKTNFAPLRLFNLVLVLPLVGRISSQGRFWQTRMAKAVIRCGENSIEVFSAGVILSYTATLILVRAPLNLLTMAGVNVVGCGLLVMTAAAFSSSKKKKAVERPARTWLRKPETSSRPSGSEAGVLPRTLPTGSHMVS